VHHGQLTPPDEIHAEASLIASVIARIGACPAAEAPSSFLMLPLKNLRMPINPVLLCAAFLAACAVRGNTRRGIAHSSGNRVAQGDRRTSDRGANNGKDQGVFGGRRARFVHHEVLNKGFHFTSPTSYVQSNVPASLKTWLRRLFPVDLSRTRT